MFFRTERQKIKVHLRLPARLHLLTFENGDALFEQLAVKLEANRHDMAALFRAEQVARAANFQVAHGDFEAAAQHGVLLDGADPFPGVGEQTGVARQQQVGIRLMLVTANASAQLIKVAQTETVGAIDDQGVRVRNIEAAFDDRRGQQHIGIAVDEFRHHFLQIVTVHLAVADDDARVGDEGSELLRHRFDGHHPVVQEKHLAAAIQFALHCVANDALVVLCDNGLNRQPVLRRRSDRAHVARAREREVKCARNGCGAQCEHVHQPAHLFELLLLHHAETLLLVDDDQSEVLEASVVLHQPMGADDDVHGAGGKVFDHSLLLTSRAEAGEQLDAHGIIRHPFAECVEMLLRQHRRRHQHRHLTPIHHRFERGANGNFGLSETDVTADQAVHRLGGLHVGLGFEDGAHLIGCLLVNERFFKLALPRCIGREGVAGPGFARGLDGQ